MSLPQPLNQLRPVKDVAKGRGALVLRGAHARLRPIRRGWQCGNCSNLLNYNYNYHTLLIFTVCMYAYMYICIYICMCMYMYVYMCVYSG